MKLETPASTGDEPYNISGGRISVLFFSREERRIHVHVHSANGEAKFWLEPDIEMAQN